MAQMQVVLVLSLLLIVAMAESRNIGIDTVPSCISVYAAQIGDTCFSVAQQFKLTAEVFSSINPNLVCDNIFAGQWLCVAGSI
ncbi:hypothetical protein ACH5RR_028911 [Cinchona calisaya]|uniref:LysM domain-containing protein n=1 Tax=Cinchona calisaya TaxID=153742 RepID=A0ABD2YQ50_9GENT